MVVVVVLCYCLGICSGRMVSLYAFTRILEDFGVRTGCLKGFSFYEGLFKGLIEGS